MKPKVFISYSWTSPSHQAQIREWAERLVSDGIDTVFDIWDLNEGDDKYAYMERMVTDDAITHVLVFSDSEYAIKADNRKAGVGTESQIISNEIYQKVSGSKFIPIVCQLSENREPILPTFMKSRIWIDFSSPEAANKNWEQLIRALYDKPVFVKPPLGKTPSYLTDDDSIASSKVVTAFIPLKEAILNNKTTINYYRSYFLDSCYEHIDNLRIRKLPQNKEWGGEDVLKTYKQLKPIRNYLVDWILLESHVNPSEEFEHSILSMLEKLLEFKVAPSDISHSTEDWYEAHRVFVYESFIYVVAALLEKGAYKIINTILTSRYLLHARHVYNVKEKFVDFGVFYTTANLLQILAPPGKKLLSPIAELIKQQADRTDLPFDSINQAELLIFMMALISDTVKWFPHTMIYSSYIPNFPFFIRASQNRYFQNLVQITGIDNAEKLREAVENGHERLQVHQWNGFKMVDINLWHSMNLDELDTIP